MHVHEQVAHRVMRSVLAPRDGAGQGSWGRRGPGSPGMGSREVLGEAKNKSH